ncbi:hypothetical protein CRUP_001488 [Coryphaenoides rupestris]|nr:hypothetical protein CRUP_001488 [Coryphaenoides rupestris]
MADCLQRETETLLQMSQVSKITSVFFGGGTPSLAHPSTVARVLESVSRHASLSSSAEVTIEVNPTPSGRSRLEEFRHAGVNRFSIGVQSLRDEDLKLLGRDHNSQHALRTLAEARRLCPGRVSADVMFGRPAQTPASWESELSELLSACDDHVSLYELTVERGTALFKQVEAGHLAPPPEEEVAAMYLAARTLLRDRGFRQYEVSNFARHNAVSHHNMNYWKGGQYIGVGPGRPPLISIQGPRAVRPPGGGQRRQGGPGPDPGAQLLDSGGPASGARDPEEDSPLHPPGTIGGGSGDGHEADEGNYSSGELILLVCEEVLLEEVLLEEVLLEEVLLGEVLLGEEVLLEEVPGEQVLLEEVLLEKVLGEEVLGEEVLLQPRCGLSSSISGRHGDACRCSVATHWQTFCPDADLYKVFSMSLDVQNLLLDGQLILDDRGLRCSWDGLAVLDGMLPTLLLALERYLQP